MFLFLSTIAAIMIVTGIIYILYILYREMMSPIHPLLGKVWIAASLSAVFLALLSECYAIRRNTNKIDQEQTIDLGDLVRFPKVNLMDVK